MNPTSATKVQSPFLVGITGDLDPVGYEAEPNRRDLEGDQIREIRQKFEAIFRWIFLARHTGVLDPVTGLFQLYQQPKPNEYDAHGRLIAYHDCWLPLALHASPVVVLSTLAPGISTLFVEAALDFQEQHPYWPLSVRGVLPFTAWDAKENADICSQANIYRTDADRRRYFELLRRMRAQPGWNEQRDLFETKLDNDWGENTARQDLTALEDNNPVKRRCDLRYRAAGEYVAAFCDLLVAAYDYRSHEIAAAPKLDDMFNWSPHAIVEAKRRGLSWELLAVANNFTWADNGPVMRFGIESYSTRFTQRNYLPSSSQMKFLHPIDAKPIHVDHTHKQDHNQKNLQDHNQGLRQNSNQWSLQSRPTQRHVVQRCCGRASKLPARSAKNAFRRRSKRSIQPRVDSLCIGKRRFRTRSLHSFKGAHERLTPEQWAIVDAAWQANGDSIFRRILKLQDDFNTIAESPNEDREIYAMILNKDELKLKSLSKFDALLESELSSPAVGLVRELSDTAKFRRRVADYSSTLEFGRGWVMFWLIILIGIAAVSLATFEHWHPKYHETIAHACIDQQHFDEDTHHETSHAHPKSVTDAGETPVEHGMHVMPFSESELEQLKKSEKLVKILLLMGTLGCILVAGGGYFLYARQRWESKRFDARALGEALRVQIFWCLSGLNSSVAANYMQRQRDELDWIRYVTSGLAFPFFRWKSSFQTLSAQSRIRLLERVRIAWVKKQEEYFEKNVCKIGRKSHFWHVVAWSFASAGIFQILFMFLSQLPWLKTWLDPILLGLVVVLATVSAWPAGHFLILALEYWEPIRGFPDKFPAWIRSYWKRHAHEETPSNHSAAEPSLWQWIKDRRDIVYLTSFLTAVVLLVRACLPDSWPWAPGQKDWWIILTSATLLLGGLSLAWVERNFYSEVHRNFSSMRMLYHSADIRLRQILTRCQDLEDAKVPGQGMTAAQDRLIREAQDILYNLGSEALNETAEWLILRRSRPLEPFMAG